MHKAVRNIFLVLFFALQMTGCIAVRGNHLPLTEYKGLQLDQHPKTKVYSEWTLVNGSMPMTYTWQRNNQRAMIDGMFETALKNTDCCVFVQRESEADVTIKGLMHPGDPGTGTNMLLGMLWGATAAMVPSWVTFKPHARAIVSNRSKTVTYELKDTLRQYVWLPMIIAFPFVENPMVARDEMDANLYRNLVEDMNKDGFFFQMSLPRKIGRR